MRRGEVKQPEELLELAGTTAERVGKPIDVLYAEAIERYIEVTKHTTAGALRSRIYMTRKSSMVTIEIPEELFERAEKLAERLEKKRDVMLCRGAGEGAGQARGAGAGRRQRHESGARPAQRGLAPVGTDLNASSRLSLACPPARRA